MASAADLTELNEKECSVCHELFIEPKLLACGHLMCRHCLISWLKSLPEAQCPLCRCPIVEAKDRGGKNLEDIADSFPTDLAMKMIVDAERVLNKGHSCCVCEDVAATSMCLTCGDTLCKTCTKAHRKMSSSRHHTVEDLSSLTPEKMAAGRPERCALHADEASRFYCRKHGAAICSLCAATDHRSCPEVTKLETKMEEARATLKKLVSILTTGETELKSAMRQLDQHLQETEKRTQEAIAETDAVCDRLESAVKECRRRVREQAQSACSDVREAVQGGKVCLLNRQGKMATHKRVAQRVQEMKTCADLESMTSVMRARVTKDLDRGSALPPDAKVINTVSLVVDPQVVSCIENGLSELALVNTAPANLLQQVRSFVMLVKGSNLKLIRMLIDIL